MSRAQGYSETHTGNALVAARTAEIPAEHERLMRTVEQLGETINVLVQHLEPVCAPFEINKQTVPGAPDSDPQTLLGHRFRAADNYLREYLERLTRTIAQIEL